MSYRAAKIEETRRLAEQGFSYKQIATALSETYATVRERCKNHQIAVTNKQPKAHLNPDHKEKLAKGLVLLETGITIAEAASQSGVNVQTLYYHARNYREKRRKESTKHGDKPLHETIAELAAKGYQKRQIADMVGVSITTVSRVAGKYDIDIKQATTNKLTDKAGFNAFQLLNDVFNSKPITRNPNRLPAW